jgi:chloramphenicol 3-O-phosphotransferase
MKVTRLSPRAQLKDGEHVVLAFFGTVYECIVSSRLRADGRYDVQPIIFAADEEGTVWARGWRTEAARALRAFAALTT